MKTFATPEPCKPVSGSIMERVKDKASVLLLPMCIILIVYCVDSALYNMGKPSAGETPSGASAEHSYNLLEVVGIVACVVLPALYFNNKHITQQRGSKVPSPSDANARLRAKAGKSTNDDVDDGAKRKPLSEQLSAATKQDGATKQS